MQTVRKALQGLQPNKKPLVASLDFGTLPTVGRLSKVFFLTKHGAAVVAEQEQADLSGVHYPKNQTHYGKDYFHRLATIDFHILLHRFCQRHQAEIDFFLPYYHFSGANHTKEESKPQRQSLNRIDIGEGKHFVPDSVFSLTDPENKQWIFSIEIHRGHDTKRAIATLTKHAQAIEQGSINAQYQYNQAIPVLMVCETKAAKRAIQRRLSSLPQFQNLEKYILLKSEEELHTILNASFSTAFAKGWQTYTGKEVILFAQKKPMDDNSYG